MNRLYFSEAAEEACASAGASILVGHRCVLSSSSPQAAASFTAIAVAECVPCEDSSVAEEQVECLERVLPFGMDVIGVAGSASEVAELAAQLPSAKSREWVAVVQNKGPAASRSCHLLGTPSTKVEVATERATFIKIRFALHSCELPLPLLLSSHGTSPVLMDGESTIPLWDLAPMIVTGAQCVQLGAAATTLRIHVVLAPALVSAKGLYGTLRRQIDSAILAGTTRLVEVQSHNTHISYCCRVEPGVAAQGAELSAEALEEVFEMIEDATGAAATHSDVKGCTSAATGRKATDTTATSEKADTTTHPLAPPSVSTPKQKADSNLLLLLLGLVVVILGVVVVVMQ